MFLELTIVLEVVLSIEKKVNSKHTFNIMGFGSPTVQGRQGISLQEAYDLTGENFYNPYWGYQTQSDGTKKKEMQEIETITSLISL